MHLQSSKTNQCDSSVAHTYRFHPTILQLKRTTRDEALEILKSNRFVVVSHQWPQLDISEHELSVPIITENQMHVARFKHHDLRVHTAPPLSKKSGGNDLRSFLMLASDLTAFTRLMKLRFSGTATPAQVLSPVEATASPGLELRDIREPSARINFGAVVTKLQLQSHTSGKPETCN